MSKPYLVYSAPVATVSGYGEHARDILLSLKESDKYDIQVVTQKWGDTPMNGLDSDNEFHNWILERMVSMTKDGKLPLKKRPDIWIQLTVPNEFQPIGKYNIGITAGIETNLVDAEWIQGMNRMDLNIVPSEHAKQSFLNSVYTQKNTTTGEETTLKIEKPIEVIFEGFDENIYTNKVHQIDDTLLQDELTKIPEDFVFLFVGHWLKGETGHDRKDIGTLIKTFCETFKNTKKKPALLLKTSAGKFGVLDREQIVGKITNIKKGIDGDLPNVYLLHGELTNQEMNNLYNFPKVKAMVSFTKGEGFGRPLLEFTQTGKPVIASGWSGHTDFLTPEESLLLGGELKNVHESASWDKVIIKESKWFYVDVEQAKKALKAIFKDYSKFVKPAQTLMKKNRKLTLSNMKQLFIDTFDKYIPEFPKEIELKLPDLKKID